MDTKICKKCLREEPLSNFKKYSTKGTKDKKYISNICDECVSLQLAKRFQIWKTENPILYVKKYKRANAKLKDNPEKLMKYRDSLKKKTHLNVEKTILNAARSRARRSNLEFNLTLEDIVIPEMCPILNIKISMSYVRHNNGSPSLDRIDNSKGYIKGNVRIISYLANAMKNSATLEQLILFSKNIVKYIQPALDLQKESTVLH